MKFKNIFIILNDSMTDYNRNEFLKDFEFYNKNKENIVYFDNIFSCGPYTEAAINPLMTGRYLSNIGYMNNLKYEEKIMTEIFKEYGYKTYSNIWNYINSKSFKRGVDYHEYLAFPNYNDLYMYRLKEFKKMHEDGCFDNEDLQKIKEILIDFFEEFKVILMEFLTENKSTKFLRDNYIYEVEEIKKVKDIFEEELELLLLDDEKYIIDILYEKRVNLYIQVAKGVKKSRIYINKETKIRKICLKKSIRQLWKTLGKTKKNKSLSVLFENIIKEPVGWKRHLMYTLNYSLIPRYELPSATNIQESTKRYINENQNCNNFMLIHNMDTHFPFNFVSSDLNDEKKISAEIERFEKIKNRENIFSSASIQYVSSNLEDFVEFLREKNLLEESLIVIVSDHGHSFTNSIFRREKVSTSFDENYKIPFMIYNPLITGGVKKDLGSVVDILPTILSFSGLSEDKLELEGISLLEKKREYIITDYMGAGCPYNKYKKRLISIRTEEVKCNYEFYKNKLTLKEMFNLKKDKYEQKRLVRDEQKEIVNKCNYYIQEYIERRV